MGIGKQPHFSVDGYRLMERWGFACCWAKEVNMVQSGGSK